MPVLILESESVSRQALQRGLPGPGMLGGAGRPCRARMLQSCPLQGGRGGPGTGPGEEVGDSGGAWGAQVSRGNFSRMNLR